MEKSSKKKGAIPEKLHVQDFRTLEVYKKCLILIDEIYKVVEKFPETEKYIVSQQLLRAMTSVSANIAEGNGQLYSLKEFSSLNVAVGEASETRFWLELSYKRKYITETQYNKLDADVQEIVRMLLGKMKKIKQDIEGSEDS